MVTCTISGLACGHNIIQPGLDNYSWLDRNQPKSLDLASQNSYIEALPLALGFCVGWRIYPQSFSCVICVLLLTGVYLSLRGRAYVALGFHVTAHLVLSHSPVHSCLFQGAMLYWEAYGFVFGFSVQTWAAHFAFRSGAQI